MTYTDSVLMPFMFVIFRAVMVIGIAMRCICDVIWWTEKERERLCMCVCVCVCVCVRVWAHMRACCQDNLLFIDMTCQFSFQKVSWWGSPDIIPCGWQGSKHQLTKYSDGDKLIKMLFIRSHTAILLELHGGSVYSDKYFSQLNEKFPSKFCNTSKKELYCPYYTF